MFEVQSTCNNFSVDLDSFSDEIEVAGRLHLPESIKFFESIGASKFIINVLKKGHHPKLKSPVPDYEFKNNASYFKHRDFADDQVKRLLKRKCIEQVFVRPKCVNPLSVAVQRTKN